MVWVAAILDGYHDTVALVRVNLQKVPKMVKKSTWSNQVEVGWNWERIKMTNEAEIKTQQQQHRTFSHAHWKLLLLQFSVTLSDISPIATPDPSFC